MKTLAEMMGEWERRGIIYGGARRDGRTELAQLCLAMQALKEAVEIIKEYGTASPDAVFLGDEDCDSWLRKYGFWEGEG